MRNRLQKLKQVKSICPVSDPASSYTSSLVKGSYRPFISHEKILYDHRDFKYLKVKRKHHRKLRIDCNSIYFYISNPHELVKLSKYSKHLHTLEIHAILFSYKVSLTNLYKLMPKLNRICSVRLYFGIVYLLQSESEISRIRRILSKIRANLTNFFAEIYLGSGANAILSWFVRSAINTLNPMQRLKRIRIQLPKLASRLGTIFNQQDDPCDQSEALVRLYQVKFQRLTRLENIHLPFLISHHPMLTCFTNKFSHLPNLKSLEVASYDTPYGKFIAEDLKAIKTLQSLTLYYCLEPEDVLDLLSQLPLLKSFAIRDDWLFSKTLVPTIKSCKNYRNIEVTTLLLDFPVEIVDEDDAKLFASFLKQFVKLESLKVYICCEGSINLLNPLMKAICGIANLKDLSLGVFLRSGKVLSLLLKNMYSITRLERISLTMKLSYGSTWEQTIDGTFKALEGFLHRNKELKCCDLFWEKFTPRCAEYLTEMMDKMHYLELFKLAYVSQYRDHGQAHDQMIATLEKSFKRATNFKKVVVVTSCPSHLYEGCEGRGRDIRRYVGLNKVLKSFKFETVTQVWTPFYNDQLLFY